MNEFSSTSQRETWQDTCADLDTRMKAVERAVADISEAMHRSNPQLLEGALKTARDLFAAVPLNPDSARPELGVRYAAMLLWLLEVPEKRATMSRQP